MLPKVVLMGCFLVSTTVSVSSRIKVHPDVGLNALQLIVRYKYPLEVHTVRTEDGYLLGTHRIPNVKSGLNPVLLVSGLLGSSADYVNMANKSLAFILSDLGYDVWLLNPRGTTWSRKHERYNSDRDAAIFWNFSWHEIGYYDLPAVIDYVLSMTNSKQLYYVGHSQGTTAFFVMASTKPEYNKKVRLFTALAPVAYMSNTPNVFLREVSKLHAFGDWFTKSMNYHEFMPHSEDAPIDLYYNCEEFFWLCHPFYVLISGFDPNHIDMGRRLVITSNVPAGASVKQLLHFAQLIHSGRFAQYDYGIDNLRHYQNLVPPQYNLSAISAPIAFYYSKNDWFVSEKDAQLLYQALPNVVYKHLVESPTFGHVDFLWSKDVVEMLYKKVIEVMSIY